MQKSRIIGRSLPASLLFCFTSLSSASACGIQGFALPPGTPVQMITISNKDRPWMNFSQAQSFITSAAIASPPCHGKLIRTQPLGFKYVPRPGFAGRDMYVVQGGNAFSQCSMTGAILDVVR